METTEQMQAKLDRVYLERNMLACALARMAQLAGFDAGRGIDTSAPPTWDPEWLRVVYVMLPDGQQVSWHMGPGTEHVWSTLPEFKGEWDGTMLGREPEWPDEVDWPAAPAPVAGDAVARAREILAAQYERSGAPSAARAVREGALSPVERGDIIPAIVAALAQDRAGGV